MSTQIDALRALPELPEMMVLGVRGIADDGELSASDAMVRGYTADQMRAYALAALASQPRVDAGAVDTLPVEVRGKLYDVPIPVQLHIVMLREKVAGRWPGMFESETALAEWLESLCECEDDGAIGTRKWEPAQRAAAAIRNTHPPLPTGNAALVADEDLLVLADTLEQIRGSSFGGYTKRLLPEDVRDALRLAADKFRALAAQPAGGGLNEQEKAARRLYNRWAGNQDIHCNRFPSWEELSEKSRQEWRDKATTEAQSTGGVVDAIVASIEQIITAKFTLNDERLPRDVIGVLMKARAALKNNGDIA